MATPTRFLNLSRSFFSKQTLTLTLISPSSSPLSSRLRPLAAALHRLPPLSDSTRHFSTRQSQSSLNDNSNPNWSNRPPKETILLDGCDFEHWLVVTEPPPEGATRDEIIDSYIKTLAQVVGSEEEARMKIYSVSTRCYFAFGALVSEELSYKLKELPHVRWVLPDSYLDVKNKDYGGEPFIDGQAVPYDPKYHEEWIRNNQKAMERNRRNDRPRNADRSRNFDRRQRNNMGGPGGPTGGGPPNMGGMPNHPGGAPHPGFGQNTAPPNPGVGPNMAPPNPGYGQNAPHLNNPGYGQNVAPPPNPNFGQNMQPDPGYGQTVPHPNGPSYGQNVPPSSNPSYGRNMPPPNYGVQGNPGYHNNGPNYHQSGGTPYQNAQAANQPGNNYGHQGNTGYQGQ